MPDVTKLIEHEHRQVEALFQSFKETGNPALVSRICDELDAHTAAEEGALYPAVRNDVPSGKRLASEARAEHEEARQLIGRLRRSSNADHVRELMDQLEEAVHHHVDEEEQEMLPRARDALGESRLVAIGSVYESVKSRGQR